MTRPSSRLRPVAAAALALVGTLALAACSSGGGSGSATPAASASSSAGPTGTLTVYAAASLQQTFTTLGKRYEAAHPGAHVTFSFGGSSDLVSQIQAGAPADVFASADETTMGTLKSGGMIAGASHDFATNVLEIATAPGNPKQVSSFSDLASSSLQVVVCATPVPCGAATAKVESATGVTLHPVSEEQSVTDVLGKVEAGQADAGVVYTTDVRAAGSKVHGVPFSASAQAVNTYPIGVVQGTAHKALAASFVSYVRSTAGERVLRDAGFGKP
ncbi:molybdate ABC transporter substrate-binding protein [Curtobacterium sp. MCBD17_019]|uniref:molybdate ABC transporter substrate-binding protein n=1 Tax=Curtobacterium sp. MCBD17_019 TaxID=2175669 RepID=UPI000DA8F814|nr:molybdate ABC transporter substrate-binding protein [Curtobacterium sp. MCBD17_019]PZE73868.1 molybdate ABC transporter substrate-binding protein [Curtobacterium sp. MCBD17_019]